MMKYVVSSIAAIFLSATSPCSAGPQIHVEKDVINGVYTYGKATTFTFTVGNSGDQPLTIQEVKKTCRCTSVEIGNRILNPQGKTDIILKYEPDMSGEEFHVKVLVKSDATNEPLKVLTVVGRNYPPNIRVMPKAISLTRVVGDISTIEPVSVTVQASNQVVLRDVRVEPRDSEKGNADANTPVFVVEKVATQSTELKFVLRAVPPREIGDYKETLHIDVDTDGKTYNVGMPVELRVVPEFELVPSEILVPSTSQSATYTVRMLVRSRDGKVFTIKDVKAEEFIKTRFQKNVSGSYFIYLAIMRAAGVDGRSSAVSVTLEKEGNQVELKCPIRFLEASSVL